MLARNELAPTETNGVVLCSPDGGGVADRKFERLAVERLDTKFGGHGKG
jgi:hypothetical protein